MLLITLERLDWVSTDAVGIQRPIVGWPPPRSSSAQSPSPAWSGLSTTHQTAPQGTERGVGGNLNASVKIYDGSDLGLLQAGFNDMVADLRERQDLRNLFGRYVGEDVARRAIETGTELGGEERYVGVLFVDIVGSTRLAVDHPPREVVELLNEFFRVVVSVVGKHGGFVNKFQGDAALAIFGARSTSTTSPDAPSPRPANCARSCTTHSATPTSVSASRRAGHRRAHRLRATPEYTVIGDPVNEAARLTELAMTSRRGSSVRRARCSWPRRRSRRTGRSARASSCGRGIETLLARPHEVPTDPTADEN